MVLIRNPRWWPLVLGGVLAAVLVAAPTLTRGRDAPVDTPRKPAGEVAAFPDAESAPTAVLAPAPTSGSGAKPAGDLQVVFHRPTDEAPYDCQVQVGFDAPLVPLTDLSAPQRERVLSHFAIVPKPPGAFRLVGTQAVVFEPQSPFPAACEYTVTVKGGLEDIHGRRLAEGLSWQFHTKPISLSFDREELDGLSLRPRFDVESNGALQVESLAHNVTCTEVANDGTTLPVAAGWRVIPSKGNPPVVQQVTEERRQYRYSVEPREPLTKARKYRLTLGKGVKPAGGTLASASGVTLNFSTYGPLSFKFSSTSQGAWHQSDYQVTADNPLEDETIRGAVSIAPPIDGDIVWLYHHSTELHLANRALRPDTDYTLTINTKARDTYGQRLAEPWVYKFHTSHLRPRVEVLDGAHLLTPRTAPTLPFRAINPGAVTADTLPVTEEQLVSWCLVREETTGGVIDAHAPEASALSYMYPPDAVEVRNLSLGPLLGDSGFGLVLYRLTTREEDTRGGRPRPVVREGAVLRTNLALHAQLLPAELHLWATHLTDGSPARGCAVKVYRCPKQGDGGGSMPRLAATGETDQAGRLRIPAEELRDQRDGEGQFLRPTGRFMVTASDGDDFSFVADIGSLYTYVYLPYQRVTTGWEGPEPRSLGCIFSDRELYQPQDEVNLKGVVRYRAGDQLVVPVGVEFAVTLRDPLGATTDLGTATADEFGGFSVVVPPKPTDALGYYRVSATAKAPVLSVSGSFRRADFVPPRYQADLTADKSVYIAGEKIVAQAQASYLFGAPLTGGSAAFRVNTRPKSFSPDGWDGFGFRIPEWIQNERGKRESHERNLVKQTKELDDHGRATIGVPVVAADVPSPMAYEVEVDVKDVSGQSVGASKAVTALPYSRLTGVRLERSFVPAGKPCSVQIIVTDPNGQALSGVSVRVELLSLRWVRKSGGEDEDEDRGRVLKTDVVRAQSVTSKSKPVTVAIVPPKAGQYLIVARLAGHKPTGTEGAGWFYASGSGAGDADGEARDAATIELHTDRETYAVGDEVEVAVPSPFKRAQMLMSVEREKIFAQRCEEIAQGIGTFTFRVTEEMIPNVYVQVSLTELGPESGNLFGDPAHLPYRVGFADVTVSRAPHRLKVAVSPRKPDYRPGDTAAVDFHVESASGEPAQVQLTAMIVDEAVLQLTDYRPPDLAGLIFPHRDLSLELFDNRPLVIHARRALKPPPKGWGYDGGGEGEGGTPGTRLRADFKRIAYFNADLRTDDKGNAECEFPVPDNLTTWRALAVAVSSEDDFGAGDATFLVNQRLMLLGLLPRFARVDDSITAGVAINNQTGVGGKATVTCAVPEGDNLLRSDGEPVSQQSASVESNRTGAVRFPKRATGVGDCVLRFECAFEGADVREGDRLQLPLSIQEPGAWESVAVSKQVRGDAEFPIELTDAIRGDLGYVKASLSSTAFGNLAPDAEWLLQYPYGCAEQLASRLLGLLSIEEPARRFGLTIASDKPLGDVIRGDLGELLKCQQEERGGFAYWSGSERSDPILSTYVALVLAEARRHGYDVPESAWKLLTDYLKSASPPGEGSEEAKLHFRVLQAEALAALGTGYTEYYGAMVTGADKLSVLDQIRLDGLLYRREDWAQQAADLHGEIRKHEWITDRSAQLQAWRGALPWWSYMDTPDALTAAGLMLDLRVEPDYERVPMMAAALVEGRQHKRWRDTYGTARTLEALSRYVEVRESTAPDFTVSVGMDDRQPTDVEFKGYKLGRQTSVFPLADLGIGAHRLALQKAGSGTLYATIELQYMPKGEQPPRNEGFCIERTMTNLRTGKPVTGVAQPIRVGDVVRVELTLNTPQNAYNVAVESPVPAGLEPMDKSLKTTPSWAKRDESGADRADRWRPNPFDHTELHRDRVALFAEDMPAGVYVYDYLLQATSPGEFTYPPARVYRMYEPEEFGSTKSDRVSVSAS